MVGLDAYGVRGVGGVSLAQGKSPAPAKIDDGAKLVQQHQCISCHASDQKLIGPAWRAIADKYRGQEEMDAKLMQKLQQGGAGAWGEIPMPAQNHVPQTQLQSMLRWILRGAK